MAARKRRHTRAVLVQQRHHAGKEGNAIFLITILIEENLPPCTVWYLHWNNFKNVSQKVHRLNQVLSHILFKFNHTNVLYWLSSIERWIFSKSKDVSFYKTTLVSFWDWNNTSKLYGIYFSWVVVPSLFPKLFCYSVRKKCSSDQEKLLKFMAEGREFSKKYWDD